MPERSERSIEAVQRGADHCADTIALSTAMPEREGGVEHVGADAHAFAIDYDADWFTETLGGKTAA